jgi:hypothetical protein
MRNTQSCSFSKIRVFKIQAIFVATVRAPTDSFLVPYTLACSCKLGVLILK